MPITAVREHKYRTRVPSREPRLRRIITRRIARRVRLHNTQHMNMTTRARCARSASVYRTLLSIHINQGRRLEDLGLVQSWDPLL